MKEGKLISTYLLSGDPHGVICTYLSNWTGQAIRIPKLLIENVKNRKEINKPGIYLLFYEIEGMLEIYVGESENVYKRLLQHIKDDKKENFYEIIAFSSKDDDLTKSHIKYLEYRLIIELEKSSKYSLKNTNINIKPHIPEMYISVLEEYLKNIKILLPTLGYSLFIEKNRGEEKEVQYDSREIIARGILTKKNGIIVLKGSKIKKEIKDSMSQGYRSLREKLVKKGIVDIENEIFIKDWEFSSPSSAAVVISGTAVNGRKKWLYRGKTLEEIENEKNKRILQSYDMGD